MANKLSTSLTFNHTKVDTVTAMKTQKHFLKIQFNKRFTWSFDVFWEVQIFPWINFKHAAKFWCNHDRVRVCVYAYVLMFVVGVTICQINSPNIPTDTFINKVTFWKSVCVSVRLGWSDRSDLEWLKMNSNRVYMGIVPQDRTVCEIWNFKMAISNVRAGMFPTQFTLDSN